MRIGITDTYNGDIYENYIDWLRSVDSAVECVKLSYVPGNADEIQKLDGLLLSGGGDVHPKYYDHHDVKRNANNVDEKRDAFEFELIDQALNLEIPIFGICRGMQTMNVCLNGSLIVDLVSSRFHAHTGSEEPIQHTISVVPKTLLHALTGTIEADVNSFHHQAVDRLGRGLMAAAFSPDGVIEAAEWVLKEGMPFLMLVQWHPERIKENILSHKLALMFLRESKNYKQTKNNKSTMIERIN
jgi:putative glutamine amidotransferase